MCIRDSHDSELVLVESLGEIDKRRVALVGRRTVYDELMTRHTDRELAPLRQHRLEASCERIHGAMQHWVGRRIDAALVNGERQLLQQLEELLRWLIGFGVGRRGDT